MPKGRKVLKTTPIRRIALVMQPWAGYLQQVRLGIADYLLQKPDWRWCEFWPSVSSVEEMSRMEADGAIVFLQSPYVEVLKELSIPIVDVSNHAVLAEFPTVLPDDLAIGKIAADYLISLGLRHFAFAGFRGAPFSDLRQQSFVGTVVNAGFKVSTISVVHSTVLRQDVEPGTVSVDPMRWLGELPKPTGLFAVNDGLGARLLEACRQLHISVPDSLCVLGVDDDELISRITHPPLSSISIFGKKVGFEAARMLDELMSGRNRTLQKLLLPPEGVIARQSTNLLAIPDADVLAAVRFIRENIHKQITVRDVLRVVPVNRRYLERKFVESLGRTPLQEIRRVRLEQVKQLLMGTDLSMPRITSRSGFRSPARMANVFRQTFGITPTHFRRQFRLDDRS